REPEHPAPDMVSVPVLGDDALTTVVARLAAEKIAVTELSLRLPSLDEVFYSLTGHVDGKEVAA
ncbi:MAG: daunorubicin/doxorubicin resistance ABC transporter ATP-binding protein DrrA, partial [Actinobacteria bacterium]|nr:daunorubicin/doxorubicin resistance ABC transporter ATP-binding protein DrrA [Actinomycetota bacterium]